MMLFLCSCLTISISLALLNAFTPLALGFWVMMLSLSIALTTSMNCFSWFGFMIFLIYVGGMLVMFAYFVAIQPNQQLDLTISMSSVLFTTFLLMLLMPFTQMSNLWSIAPTWITTMLNMMNLITLTILALTLFLAMLSVVKISSAFMGPLRPFS
nr:NADH dehydrogenase subunit 6 [Micropodarke fujianensis]